MLFKEVTHHGKERLVEIWYPSEKRRTQRTQKVIMEGLKPMIDKKRKGDKAQEEMEMILRKRRNPRGGCAIQASRRKRSGMSTMRRTSRTDRGAKLV